MQFPSRDFTAQQISLSYQDVVQTYTQSETSSYLLDGLGNVILGIPTSSIGYTIITSDVTSSMTVWSASNSTVVNVYEVSSSFASSSISSSIVPFNGNRTIKRGPYTSLNVGGTNVTDFLNSFFFPFIGASVSISGGGTFETGSSQNLSISSTVTANDETIFGTASVNKDSVLWNSASIPPLSYLFSDVNIDSNHSYNTVVSVDNNGSPTTITSNTTAVSFIYPYLWGTSSIPGLSGNTLYTTLTKQVVSQGNKTISMIGSVVYIYFAYPASYPVLTSIIDPNNFEAIGNFQYSASVPVTSSGLSSTWMTNYKVYRTTLVSDPNGTYQFKY